jgi:hypothetical protein
VILYPKKITAFLILLGCSIFVVIGIAMIISGETPGYLVAGFFGLCSVVAIVRLFPGSSYLCLDSEGFISCSLFEKQRLPGSVDEFFVITLKRRRK